MDDKEMKEAEVKKEENVSVVTTQEKQLWDGKVVLSFIISAVFLGIGFYKLYAYKNSELDDPVNAYVGGDAYNYIINSNLGIAYFVLALIFVVLGCTFFISNHLNNRK